MKFITKVALLWALLLAPAVSFAVPCWAPGSTIAAGQVLANSGYVADCPRPTSAPDPHGTWASRPTGPVTGQKYLATDIGTGILLLYDGTKWKPLGGVAVISRAMPAAALTGSTSETLLRSFTVPAGLLSSNAQVRLTMLFSTNSTANNKSFQVRLGSAAGTSGTSLVSSPTFTSGLSFRTQIEIDNNGSQSSQVAGVATRSGLDNSGAAPGTASFNTATTATVISITGTLATGTDTLTLLGYTAEWIEP